MKVYLLQHGARGPIKIGRAANPEKRVASLQTACPYEMRLLVVVDNATKAVERGLHHKFAKYWIRGEWFRPSREILDWVAAFPDVDIPELPSSWPKKATGVKLGRKTEFDLDGAKRHIRGGLNISQAAVKLNVDRQRLHYHVLKDPELVALLAKREKAAKKPLPKRKPKRKR